MRGPSAPSERESASSAGRRPAPFPDATMPNMRLADRMSRLGSEGAFAASARARALEATGRSVIHLEIGEPDFATPANIVAAAKRALDDGWTHYPPAGGLPELRSAIAAGFDGASRRPGVGPPGARDAGCQAGDLLRDPRAGPGRRRGHLPGSWVPDIRIDDPVRRRDADPRCRFARRTTSASIRTSSPAWSRRAPG